MNRLTVSFWSVCLAVTGMTTGQKLYADAPTSSQQSKATAVAADGDTDRLSPLRDKIRRVVNFYRPRMLNSVQHSPWEIMHGFLPFGVQTELHKGGPGGESITAIGWLCFNHPSGPSRQKMFIPVDNGKFVLPTGPGYQGHHGQFLAMLAQSRVRSDYPLRIGEAEYTVADLVEHEQLTCRPHSELTFKLIGLSHYLNADATWKNDHGQDWDIARLVREERTQPVQGAACGGTHRLMSLSYAIAQREKDNFPIDGEYKLAQDRVRSFQRRAFRMQNRNGSFCANWFEGPEQRTTTTGGLFSRRVVTDVPDAERRIQTSGHILEWLVFSLSERELRQPRVVRGVYFIANTLGQSRYQDWPVGPLGHALHALILYDERVFGTPQDDGLVADADDPRTAAREQDSSSQ